MRKISKQDHRYKEVTQNGGQRHRGQNLEVRFPGRNDSEKVSKGDPEPENQQNRSKMSFREIMDRKCPRTGGGPPQTQETARSIKGNPQQSKFNGAYMDAGMLATLKTPQQCLLLWHLYFF